MSKQEDDFLRRLHATFKVEAEEHLQAMLSRLLELEKKLPLKKEAEHVEAVFRHAHSLKGAARAVNLIKIEAICQSLESCLAAWKRRNIKAAPLHFDTLHRALDLIGTALLAASGEEAAVDDAELLAVSRQLDRLAVGDQTDAAPATSSGPAGETGSSRPAEADVTGAEIHERHPASPAAAITLPEPAAPSQSSIPSPRVSTEQQTVRIATGKLDKLLLEAEEMLTLKSTASGRAADLRWLHATFDQWRKQWLKIQPAVHELTRQSKPLPAISATTRTDKPGVGSPDVFPQSAAQSQVAKVLEFLDWNGAYLKSLDDKVGAMARAAAQDQITFGRLIDDLLADSKELLMLPFSTLSDLFPKLVRDLSRELGKEVELVIRGGEVEISKRILEEMKGALIHLVRNCIAHGVEAPKFRAQQNKPPQALITLAVARVDGSKVEIVISDDGAGVNVEKVREAAVKQGILSAEDARQLDDQQALPLIFHSGVSTSSLITEISGRGLGLAIVREKTEHLGGRVSVTSLPHAGTTFRLTLPLSLATFRGVLVRAAERTFVIPTANVDRVARINTAEIKTVENRETLSIDGRALSMARLEAVLELPRLPKNAATSAFVCVVILGIAEERIAFAVDEVLHEEEVLVKTLAKPLSRVRNISGATILASGKLAPILNVGDLMKSARNTGLIPPTAAAGAAEEKAQMHRKRILVAEDSITSRLLLKNILETAGHEVETAVDGVEALTELRMGDFDLVVSDIEMPRMNGFDLITHIRSDRKLADKPVILVTALASREDRERGIDVGANAYIVKSSFDQSNLLDAVRRLV